MPVATTIFQALTCEVFEDGKRLLRADYSIDCDSPKHLFFEGFASVAALLIVAGQPIILLLTVIRGKHVVNRGTTQGVLVVIFRVLSEVGLLFVAVARFLGLTA